MHALRALLLLVVTVAGFLVATVVPAAAESSIDAAQINARLDADGNLRVTTSYSGLNVESFSQRIEKSSPLGDLRTFHYELSDFKVTRDGQPAEAAVEDHGDSVVLNVEVEGASEMDVEYVVSGAVHTMPQQPTSRQLRWPVAQGLDASVGSVSGSLQLLASPPDFDCQVGATGALRNCALWSIDHQAIGTPIFQDGPLEAGDVLVVSASQPPELVADSSNVETRWTLDRAFSLTPATALVSALVLLLGAVVLWRWHRRAGRDLDFVGDPTPIAELHPVAEGVAEFRVLEGVRPGQVGTVADESVDPVDITATILDLAVRGHLLISQVQAPGGIDWTITRRFAADEDLREYERCLLDALAGRDGKPVLVSEIQDAVGPIVGELQHHLYNDVVANGWFTKHPASARADFRTIGGIIIGLGLLATGILAWLTHWGLVGVAIVTIGVACLFVAREMPRRSKKGSALLAGLHGFSAILAQQRTDIFAKGHELEQISRLLPYAVVLGNKDRWIDAMVAADPDPLPDPVELDWYHAPDNWHLQQLPQSLDALIASIQGHLFGR